MMGGLLPTVCYYKLSSRGCGSQLITREAGEGESETVAYYIFRDRKKERRESSAIQSRAGKRHL
jgi:hypothetical protein